MPLTALILTSMLIYDVHQLTKIYPHQTHPANDHISLTVEAGDFLGLLGDNGAGKTTLVKQMAQLLQPTSGEILFMGQPLGRSHAFAASRIAYMPQSGMALNNLTVGEALYFTAHLRGLSHPEARRERDAVLERLHLGHLHDQPIPRLSGGQKRLALLGITLAAAPPVMILDEPTNDLDPQNRSLVWDMLRQANRDQGATIILVTHNVLEAEKVVQRVGILRGGKLIALGRPGQLKAELNQRWRIEVIFDPAQPPTLPLSTLHHEISPGRWQIFLEPRRAAEYLDWLQQAPGVEDFRLSTASLEDLYFAAVDQS